MAVIDQKEEYKDTKLYAIRHSVAHLIAAAVLEEFPDAKLGVGPPIEDGLYYDFLLQRSLTPEDLEKLEGRVRELIAQKDEFVGTEVTADEARKLFAKQPFKLELIDQFEQDAKEAGEPLKLTTYRVGNFLDLCRGGHVKNTKDIKASAVKLTSVAGAYWRGDEKREQLQRIYATAWEKQKDLEDYLWRREEAEKRDHRKLGQELDLFSFPDEIGSGLAVFHPKGGLIRKVMEDYSRKRHEEAGYSFVNTPHITKGALFETSGHLQWFAESMFPPMELDGGTDYYLKPMNCPFHFLIYKNRLRTYKEFPLRMFEFGTVYRYEKSGVIHGLTRVRGLTQDDSHIFCTPEQMPDELSSLLNFVLDLLRDYGLTDFYLELSTRPEGKAIGTQEEWDKATDILRTVAEGLDLELVLDEGGGAFYGPKISVQARDAIGRTWQMSTIQVDFQMANRFDLEYVDANNERVRPVIIHRALFGSVERFFAVLVEHYAGAFPAWLAPVQARVLGVKDANDDYAQGIVARLKDEGFRADFVEADEPLGSRIRKAKLEKIPYILVVGDDDVANQTLGVNPRGGEVDRGVKVDDFVAQLRKEVDERIIK